VPYLIGLAALDASGRRVGELEAAAVGELDEDRQACLVRSAVSKTLGTPDAFGRFVV